MNAPQRYALTADGRIVPSPYTGIGLTRAEAEHINARWLDHLSSLSRGLTPPHHEVQNVSH